MDDPVSPEAVIGGDPVGETLIGKLGMAEKVRKLLKRYSGSARAVTTILAKDPEFKAALDRENTDRRKLMASDIHEFQTAEALAKQLGEHQRILTEVLPEAGKALVDKKDKALAQRKAEETAAATKAREFFLKTHAMADDWYRVANKFLRVTEDDLEEYVREKDKDPLSFPLNEVTGERMLPQPPTEQIEVARKSVMGMLECIKALKNDPVVQGVIKAQNVTVQQGMGQAEFHQTLFAIAKELGIPQSAIVEAYGMVVARKGGQGVIDVVPMPPKPEWRLREEERSREARAASQAAPEPSETEQGA